MHPHRNAWQQLKMGKMCAFLFNTEIGVDALSYAYVMEQAKSHF